jgi:hypothetical protein
VVYILNNFNYKLLSHILHYGISMLLVLCGANALMSQTNDISQILYFRVHNLFVLKINTLQKTIIYLKENSHLDPRSEFIIY